jgi:hypothetical protein
MIYQQPIPLKATYKNEEIIFFIQGDTDSEFFVTCEHDFFTDHFEGNMRIMRGPFFTFPIPDTHPHYNFFWAIENAIHERIRLDQIKQS